MLRNISRLRFIIFFQLVFFLPLFAQAKGNPALEADFLKLSTGKSLKSVSVSGETLSVSHGSGVSFGKTEWNKYLKLKDDTKKNVNHKVQWAFMDLTNHQLIDHSADANRKVFGASVAKVYVAATLLSRQKGVFTSEQLQQLADMLVVSSNTAWSALQIAVGEGKDDLGKQRILDFTQGMGYPRTRAFKGYLNDLHGNELTADELVEFLYDTNHDEYTGASDVWKLMHTCRTGALRGRRYLPKDLPVGAKTGTYDGATVNPETGDSLNPDGTAYKVKTRHHLLTFWIDGKQYGLAVLGNDGSEDSSALLAGGWYFETAGKIPL